MALQYRAVNVCTSVRLNFSFFRPVSVITRMHMAVENICFTRAHVTPPFPYKSVSLFPFSFLIISLNHHENPHQILRVSTAPVSSLAWLAKMSRDIAIRPSPGCFHASFLIKVTPEHVRGIFVPYPRCSWTNPYHHHAGSLKYETTVKVSQSRIGSIAGALRQPLAPPRKALPLYCLSTITSTNSVPVYILSPNASYQHHHPDSFSHIAFFFSTYTTTRSPSQTSQKLSSRKQF